MHLYKVETHLKSNLACYIKIILLQRQTDRQLPLLHDVVSRSQGIDGQHS